MIEWLREKFPTVIKVGFIVVVVASAIEGAMLGDAWGGFFGVLLGIIIGIFLGIWAGIVIFGFCATVIHIADTNDAMLKKLDDVKKTARNSNNDEGWICSKCGEKNPLGVIKCKKCGN